MLLILNNTSPSQFALAQLLRQQVLPLLFQQIPNISDLPALLGINLAISIYIEECKSCIGIRASYFFGLSSIKDSITVQISTWLNCNPLKYLPRVLQIRRSSQTRQELSPKRRRSWYIELPRHRCSTSPPFSLCLVYQPRSKKYSISSFQIYI